jgi:hypothetical protein
MATANFGYESIGGSWQNGVDGWLIGSVYALPEDGTVTSITCYLDYDSGSTDAQFGIYDTSGNLKGKTGTVVAESAGAWETANLITPVALSAGDYILCVWIKAAGTYTKYAAGDVNQMKDEPGNTWSTWPDPGDFSNLGNSKVSIYATYTIGGATKTNVVYMTFES